MTSAADQPDAGRAESLAALLEVVKKIGLTVPTEALPPAIADEAARLLKVDVACFWLIEGDHLVLAGVSGAVPPGLLADRLPLQGSLGGRVLLQDEPVVAEVSTASPALEEYIESIRAHGYTSYLGVPLRVAERAIGVLNVLGRRAFTDEDRKLAEAFAGQVVVLVEHARLGRAAAQHAERMQALADLGRLLSDTLDPDVVGQRAVDSICALLSANSAALYRLDPESGSLHELARTSDVMPPFEWTPFLGPGVGIAGVAVRLRAPVTSPDGLVDSRLAYTQEMRARVDRSPYRAFMGVPLLAKDRILGALAVAARVGRIFSDSEVRLAQSFADQTALALENARLFDDAARRGREAELLAELARTINASRDLDVILQRVAEGARDLCAGDFALIALRPAGAEDAVARCWVGATQDWRGVVIRSGRGIREIALARGQSPRMGPARGELSAGEEYRELAGHEGLSATMVVPIRGEDRVEGMLFLARRSPRAFTDRDEVTIAQLAEHTGIAIRNVRHLEESRAQLDVVRLLNSTLDSRRLLEEVAIKIAQVCGVDWCSVSRRAGETIIPLMSQFAESGKRPEMGKTSMWMVPSTLVDVPIYARAVLERRTVVVDDTRQSDEVPRAWREVFDIGSVLVIPLIRQDQVIGVIDLVGLERPRPFQRWQIELAEAIAGQLALALANARLFEEAGERLRETQALLAVADILSAAGPPNEVMRRMAREVAHALRADMVGVYELDARGETLVPLAGYHVPPALLPIFLSRPLVLSGFQEVCEAWQTGRAVWSDDMGHDPRFRNVPIDEVTSTAVLFAPIMMRTRPGGAIFAVWWRPGREFPPSEVRLIEAVANQAAAAMENARLFAENRRQVEELTVLHEVARALTGQLDRAAVLDVIVSQVPRVLGPSLLAVTFLSEDGAGVEVVARGWAGATGPPVPEPCPERPQGGLKRVVFDEGCAIRTDDYVGECMRRGVWPVPGITGPHWLGVPLRAGDTVLGAISLASADHQFTEADERLLSNIADLAALALRSARLFEDRTRAYGELAAAQDQLVRTEKLRVLGEMASGVSHDFNNLLAAILGRAQLLQREVTDPRLRQWLEVIERSAFDGAQTVRRLQEFTRIRRDHPFVSVDLNRIAAEALEITQSRWHDDARGRDVRIDVRTDFATIPKVVGDPVELREALTNIILNGVDAMPRGGTLTLATSATAREVHLTVTDTGVGMTAAVRRRIFDPFFTTKGPLGTGLGLAMTYGIIARHGARIEAVSQEGQGSTFRLIFAPDTRAPSGSPPREEAPVEAPPLTCLVVDDEEPIGALLGDVLESGGHRAVVCVDGADAIARFRKERYDAVFTDLAMPGLSGWQVARAIKTIAPDVPVFIVTGFGVELSPEDCRANGIDAVLVKPLSIRDVLAAAAGVARARAAHETSS